MHGMYETNTNYVEAIIGADCLATSSANESKADLLVMLIGLMKTWPPGQVMQISGRFRVNT